MKQRLKALAALFGSFARIGSLTFGGGLAMLPMLKHEIVEKRGWTSEEELLDYYAIGQCTPGVIAVNTATFIGYKQQGVIGAVAATLGMVTPSVVIITLLATLLEGLLAYPAVAYALDGIRAVVCALMLNTAITLAKKSFVSVWAVVLYAVVLLLSLVFSVSSVAVVLFTAALGIVQVVWRTHRAGEGRR